MTGQRSNVTTNARLPVTGDNIPILGVPVNRTNACSVNAEAIPPVKVLSISDRWHDKDAVSVSTNNVRCKPNAWMVLWMWTNALKVV